MFPCELVSGIVKNQTSLEILHRNLKQRKYVTISEFQTDFYLMCSNIIMYNGTSDASAFALGIRDAFSLLLVSITKDNFTEQFRIFREHIQYIQVLFHSVHLLSHAYTRLKVSQRLSTPSFAVFVG